MLSSEWRSPQQAGPFPRNDVEAGGSHVFMTAQEGSGSISPFLPCSFLQHPTMTTSGLVTMFLAKVALSPQQRAHRNLTMNNIFADVVTHEHAITD